MLLPQTLRASLVAGLALLAACSKNEPERPKNVLLVVVDTLRSNRLHCYGYERETSPNIDALAARGTLYEQNRAQACWTVPSMISMMSGLYVTKDETTIPEVSSLGETLQAAGMETACFLANATLFAQRGFEQGFDHFGKHAQASGQVLADAFESWHGSRASQEKPFFAWLQFVDPHEPYNPAPEFGKFTGPRVDQELVERRWREAEAVVDADPGTSEHIEFTEAVDRMVDISNLYDGEVLQADDGVGRVLRVLEESGQLEDTLVILCSDHGEMLFEHRMQPYFVQDQIQKNEKARERGELPAGGLYHNVKDLFALGHRPWYFDDVWGTPLILAGPGIPGNVREGGKSANLDIYPTILEALDLKVPHRMAGHSLWGGRAPRHDFLAAHGHSTSVIRSGDLKLVQHPPTLYLLDEEDVDAEELWWLFDLGEDPAEDRELSHEMREEFARMRELLERWRTEHDREAFTETTDEHMEGLGQMGYVEGASEDSEDE